MDKIGTKIPMLVFFLGVVFFASNGMNALDAIIRAFILAFGVALVILLITILLTFFLTLQENRSEALKLSAVDNRVAGMSMQDKKAEVQP